MTIILIMFDRILLRILLNLLGSYTISCTRILYDLHKDLKDTCRYLKDRSRNLKDRSRKLKEGSRIMTRIVAEPQGSLWDPE